MNKLIPLLNIRRFLECRSVATKLTADGKEIPKKKDLENRITLIGVDNSVSITDLKNAQNLSLRRELKLVKIQDVDSKTRRPVYKCVFIIINSGPVTCFLICFCLLSYFSIRGSKYST